MTQVSNKICLLALMCLVTLSARSVPQANAWSYWKAHDAKSTAIIDHTIWDNFLKHYVIINRYGISVIDYQHVASKDKNHLNDYLWRMSQIPIREYNRPEQLAYWVNLYNALTVKIILEHFPVDSVKDIEISPSFFVKGPWDAVVVKVDKIGLSLNDIQNRILRPIWKDPRIHYVLHLAAIGAPNLQNQALTGQNTLTLLSKAAHEYVNCLRGVKIVDGKLVVSKIYEWYKDDFGPHESDIIEHLKEYANDTLRNELGKMHRIDMAVFNWHLNLHNTGTTKKMANSNLPFKSSSKHLQKSSKGLFVFPPQAKTG